MRDLAGEPTGMLKDEAMGPVYGAMPAPSAEQVDSALARAMRWAASKGVTSVGSVSAGWDQVAALRRAHAAGHLATRVSIYVPMHDWRAAAETLRVHGPGDDVLRVAGVKAYVDGSLGSTTALLERPYLDDPKSTRPPHHAPRLARELDRPLRFGRPAGGRARHRRPGQRASCSTSTTASPPRTARATAGSASSTPSTCAPQDIARFGAHGRDPVDAAVSHRRRRPLGRKRIGPELTRTTYAFRSLLDARRKLAFGSDWSVAPLDPLLGIKAAVTRRTLDGKNPGGWVPEEKISLEETLRAYTTGVAFANFGERARGVLKVGPAGRPRGARPGPLLDPARVHR